MAPIRSRFLCAWQGAHGPNLLAPFVPTPAIVTEMALDMLQLTSDDVFVDLGCGDGRVVAAALRRGVRRSVGVELDATLVESARRRVRAALAPTDDARRGTVLLGDLCSPELATEAYGLADATAAFLFLSPRGAEALLSSRARRFGSPTLRVCSCDFRLDEQRWTLTQSRRVMDLDLYAYTSAHNRQ